MEDETICTCPGDEGICPYSADVDNEEVECTCCEACVDECAAAV